MPNLTKKEYIKYKEACREYENYLMVKWDEYAIKKTLLKEGREEGRKEGIEKGIKEGEREIQTQVVKNLLSAKKFTVEEIANFANVSESFVRKVKRELKK